MNWIHSCQLMNAYNIGIKSHKRQQHCYYFEPNVFTFSNIGHFVSFIVTIHKCICVNVYAMECTVATIQWMRAESHWNIASSAIKLSAFLTRSRWHFDVKCKLKLAHISRMKFFLFRFFFSFSFVSGQTSYSCYFIHILLLYFFSSLNDSWTMGAVFIFIFIWTIGYFFYLQSMEVPLNISLN